MKKFLLLLPLAASAVTAQAQSIAAGTISLGGSVGYNRNSTESEFRAGGNTFTDDFTTTQFQFSPAVGYFIADNLAIGLNLSYAAARTKITRTGPGRTSPNALDASTALRVGPYVQYYKMLSEQFGVLGTLGAGYLSTFTPSNNNNGSGIIETKGKGLYAALTPGVIFFPVPKFGISASVGNLGYDRLTLERSDDIDGEEASNSNFGASFGLSQLQFGGTFFIGR